MSTSIRYPVPRPIIEAVRPSLIVKPVEVAVIEDVPEGQIVTNVNLMSVP